VFGKEGYKDRYGRFGRGTPFKAPPPGCGDYAFILHILASLTDQGRAGIVCPQGVLFRGQPEVEEETGEFSADGTPKMRRRKADDEHLIREALLQAGLVDAVISLPLNVFYGAGVPACLLILRKHRPKERRGKVLLVYAARHYRELPAKNELRPQDVMRMLVHVQTYGDAALVPGLVENHKARLIAQIDEEERQETERLNAFYEPFQQRLDKIAADIAVQERKLDGGRTKGERSKIERVIARLEGQRKAPAAKINERNEKIAKAERKAENDREQLIATGKELINLYDDPDQLLKHARVVDADEIEENEYNLNIPRYVDTFEPEPRLEVKDALAALSSAQGLAEAAERDLKRLLISVGYHAA
jgi:type I restriction enzyme M protein